MVQGIKVKSTRNGTIGITLEHPDMNKGFSFVHFGGRKYPVLISDKQLTIINE